MKNETEFPCSRDCPIRKSKTFTSEIAIHFGGIEGLTKPTVFMFPTVSVCLECGEARFIVPERELEVLRTGAPCENVQVWLRESPDRKGGSPKL